MTISRSATRDHDAIASSTGLLLVDGIAWGRNRGRHVRLAVDTGATITILTPAVIADLGYDRTHFIAPTTTESVFGNAPGYLMRVDQIDCLGFPVGSLRVIRQKLPAGLDGLLGLNFLDHFVYTIHSQRNEIFVEYPPVVVCAL